MGLVQGLVQEGPAMPRPAKVWYRESTGWWMATVGGRKVKLIRGSNTDAQRELAEEKFVELRKVRRTAPTASDATVASVVESYLEWAATHASKDTYRIGRYFCQSFAEHCGNVFAADLKPYHVTKWITRMMSPERVERELARRAAAMAAGEVEPRSMGAAPKAWGPSTAHNGRSAAFRVFSWAKDEGLLPTNPLAGLKRPKPPPRQRAMSGAEFEAMHGAASTAFADYLFALWETGARPKEIRDLLWPMVQDDRWIVKNKTEKKTGKARVIILTDALKAMMARLRGDGRKNGHVFLNTEGEPWTVGAVQQQIVRLRKKLGLAGDLCAYLARHGFGTRAIMNRVNPVVVAELMGHTSLDMISRVYVHLADEHAHLKEAMEQINPPAPAPAVSRPDAQTRPPATSPSAAAVPGSAPAASPGKRRGRPA
jgi:integrase